MKYVLASDTIVVSFSDGRFFSLNESHPYYKEIKQAIEDGKPDYEIDYIFNQDTVKEAKNLLLNTGGNLTIDEHN